MQKSKWRFARDSFAALLLFVMLYIAGFVGLRAGFVDLTAASPICSYYSPGLVMNPDGILGKVVDFYKPAFILEVRYHGADQVWINVWCGGMRTW